MLARKDKVVQQNNDGILYPVQEEQGRRFSMAAAALPARAARRLGDQGNRPGRGRRCTAKHVIVATGSSPRALPGAAFDNKLILDNAGALAIPEVPKRLGVIGAGVIGLEMGSVWRRLGAEVTILEALPAFLGAVDEQVAKEAHKVFTKQGLAIHTGVKVGKVTAKKDVTVEYTDSAGTAQTLDRRQADRFDRARAQHAAASTRRPSDSSSTSAVSSRSMTIAAPTCPTCGRSATSCAARCSRTRPRKRASPSRERIAGQHGHVDFNTVPWVIYTSPEIAWVGKTEQQLKAEGVALSRGHVPVHGQRPRARARRYHGLRQIRRRCHAPTASSACTSSARWPPS